MPNETMLIIKKNAGELEQSDGGGEAGTEVLTQHLNGFFHNIVDIVRYYAIFCN